MSTTSSSQPVHYLHTAIIEVNNYPVAELYTEHRDFIFHVALQVLRNADDAEDVVQNVFLRMMRNDQGPDEGRSAVGYLRRAAKNAAIDIIRKRTQRAEMELQEYYPAPAETFVERRHVRQVIEKLPSKNAELFEMHYQGGYMYEELAASFGMQVGTVKSRLHRIRAVLQEELRAA
jgi:RNA polymerase sigma-70 factor (ECF subfamily)